MSKNMDTKSKMLELLREKKMTLTDLSRELELAPSTINQHIKELLEAGAIEQIPNPFVVKWKYYQATPEFGGKTARPEQKMAITALQPTWRFIPVVVILAIITAAAFVLNAAVAVPQTVQAQSQLGAGAVPSGVSVFSISDAPMVSSITALNISVSQVAIHSTTTGKWYIVFNGSKSFDLVMLRNTSQVLSGANIPSGTFDEITLAINNATATMNGNNVQVFVPSSTLKIFGKLTVGSNTMTNNAPSNSVGNSWINIDFDLAHSVHITGDGKIILLPVINMNGFEHSMLEVESNDIVNVRDRGVQESHVMSGMDLNGSMEANTVPVSEDTQLNVTLPPEASYGMEMAALHADIHATMHGAPFSTVITSNGSIVAITNESERDHSEINGSVHGNETTSGNISITNQNGTIKIRTDRNISINATVNSSAMINWGDGHQAMGMIWGGSGNDR